MISTLIRLFERFPYSLLGLLGRFAIANVFWMSGQTKLAGDPVCFAYGFCAKLNPFSLADSAEFLFANEYKLPLLPPIVAAHMGALAEFILPILIMIGLGTRFAALGLLFMTAVIQIFVYPGSYPVHAMWATILLMLIKFGPGKIAIDHLIARR
jgi:putative oxidoreductase